MVCILFQNLKLYNVHHLRYIEKWSLLMVAAEILTMTDNGLYFLPPDRRPAFTALTSAAVHLAPYMSLLARDCMSVADNFKKSTEISEFLMDSDLVHFSDACQMRH